MNKTLQIANGVALVFTVIFNYVSNTGVFNGKTIGNVSDEYHTLITPAGYAFSIWGLIYLLLFAFVIYTGRSLFSKNVREPHSAVKDIGWWFVISCVANCAWIVSWLYGLTGLSVIILLVMLISLLTILLKTQKYQNGTEKWLINIPFQIYAGWITVAFTVATSSWLAQMENFGFGISEITWAMIILSVVTAIHLFMTWGKNTAVFSLVAVWAFFAIANEDGQLNQISTFATITAILILISSLGNMLKRKSI